MTNKMIRSDIFNCIAFLASFLLLSCETKTSAQEEGSEKDHTNQLINESSPYLLQHAHNPVNWYPWGQKALEKAREKDKLLVISIGYAACHWCHVMEEESFEDSAVARIMNENYVSIKVDREERPDIDQIYMDAAMLINGRGGWPLNVIALPDARPVFAGTYFPKDNWTEVLNFFDNLYEKEPEKMKEQATALAEGLKNIEQYAVLEAPQSFTENDMDKVFSRIYSELDVLRGGRKGAPKFPIPNKYEFILEYYYHTDKNKALEAVENTLTNMARGGIYDHLGGGFARYSTDEDWLVPHFEKMLYDNAQLVGLYSKAFKVTGNPLYRNIVYKTLEFIDTEMTSPEGGFYSSYDADSEGEEGKYYVWTYDEIEKHIGKDAELFAAYYNIVPEGNWEDGKNILHRKTNLETFAKRENMDPKTVRKKIEAAKDKLKKARAKRVKPGLDDKILTSWNALTIIGYIEAYKTFKEEQFLKAAVRNAEFLIENAVHKDGKLFRNYKDGKTSISGFLDDYAFTIQAFIEIYGATFDEKWLYHARELSGTALENFYDETSNLFYYTSKTDDPLIIRKKELTDNVIPSSNSAMAKNLILLGNYFYDLDYLEKAKMMISNMKNQVLESPGFYTNWAISMMDFAFPVYEVAIVGNEYGQKKKILEQHYLPNVIFLGGKDEGSLELLENKRVKDKTLIYVCQNKYCKLPTSDTEQALAQIK